MSQPQRQTPETWRRAARLAGLTALLVLVSGCGGSGDGDGGPSGSSSGTKVGGVREPDLTADTSCRDFLAAENTDRDRALRQLAGELSIPDAVTTDGATQVDYACAQDPDLALGDVVISLDPPPDPDAPDGVESAEGPWPAVNEDARDAAVTGIEAYLSYRWDTLEADEEEARVLSSPEFWNESTNLWDALAENVPAVKAISEIEVLASGVVFQDDVHGVYLIALDQATRRTGSPMSNFDQSVLVSVISDQAADSEAEQPVWLLDAVETTSTGGEPAAGGGPAEAAGTFVSTFATYGPELLRGGGVSRMEDDVADVTTPEFFDDFLTQSDTIVSLIEGGEESRFTMTAAAVVSVEDDTATVLVGGSRVLTHGGVEEAPTGLRLLVDLVLVEGDWLVSDFTPVA